MARKILVANYKGGVGKTTFTYNMGCILQSKNEKVLLIDLDPQSSLSEVCLRKLKGKFEKLNNEETINEVISVYSKAIKKNISEKLKFPLENLIKNNGYVDFIPSSYLYPEGGIDIQCIEMTNHKNDIFIIKKFIEDNELDKKYDYIIFDCPPSNNIVTLSVFCICDYYIIPTIMDAISTQGIKHYESLTKKYYKKYLKNNVKIVNAAFGKEPIPLGVFEYKKKQQVKTERFRDMIKEHNYLFETIIEDYIDVANKLENGEPSIKSKYEALVDEIVERIHELEVEYNGE